MLSQHELVELLRLHMHRWKTYWLNAFFSLRYPKCRVFTFSEDLDNTQITTGKKK